jgi:hypothetical protein
MNTSSTTFPSLTSTFAEIVKLDLELQPTAISYITKAN